MFMKRFLFMLNVIVMLLFVGACCEKPEKAPLLGNPPIIPSPSLPLPDPDPEPGPAPSPEEAVKRIREYFKSQLDKDDVALPPSFLYGQPLALDAVDEEKRQMWMLWSEANTERLHLSGMTDVTAEHKEVVWDLPLGERMKTILFSKGPRPQNGYPLFINLHGGGRASVQDPWGSTINTLAWEAEVDRGQKYMDAPSIYFVPRMADDRIGRWYLSPQRNAFRRAFQLGVLSGHVDPDRVYVLGTSEGGYGSHRLALFMPDYFAGAGPMAAAEPLKAPENLRNIAFGLEMGENDRQFKRVEFAKLWKDKLRQLHDECPSDFINRIEIQSGKGHGDIDFTRMTPWLSQYQRRTYPEHISYLYYNMTADYSRESYSTGVYYLDFRKMKHTPGASMRFDLKRKGNEINLFSEQVSGVKVWGELGIYIDQMDLTRPVVVRHNGKEVFNELIVPNKGVIAESIALWGDPKRIYAAKIKVLIFL